jgi:hypothetical protein
MHQDPCLPRRCAHDQHSLIHRYIFIHLWYCSSDVAISAHDQHSLIHRYIFIHLWHRSSGIAISAHDQHSLIHRYIFIHLWHCSPGIPISAHDQHSLIHRYIFIHLWHCSSISLCALRACSSMYAAFRAALHVPAAVRRFRTARNAAVSDA